MKINKGKIRRAVEILKPEGELFEVRIISTVSKDTYSGYFTDADTLISELEKLNCADANVFFTLNFVKSGCYSRIQHDRFIKYCKNTTSDKDIEAYQYLLIDLDPIRPAGISSSKTELMFAKEKAKEVYEYLKEQGFKEPVKALSGNGVHLLYRIYLNNTPENTDLVKSVLESLARSFNDVNVNIDTTVYNPSRICKLYGTLAVKGADTPDRPHRFASITNPENKPVLNDAYLLKDLLHEENAYIHNAEVPSGTKNEKSTSGKGFDLESWLDKYGIAYSEKSESKDGTKYILEHCPFDPSHAGKDACVFLDTNGSIGFKCLHNSCSDKKWKDMRLLFEPDAYTKQKAQTQNVVKTNVDVPEWIEVTGTKKKVTYSVNKGLLAKFMIENDNFVLASSKASETIMVFWYENGCYKELTGYGFDAKIAEHISSFDISILSNHAIRETSELIKKMKPVISLEEFNTNESILNFRNGILDLETGKLMPHSPEYLTTIQLPCNYDPKKEYDLAKDAPVFYKYLHDLCSGEKDAMQLMLEYAAACISNIDGAKFKKSMLICGIGDTGKSKIITLFQKILGEGNYAVCDISELEQRFRTSDLLNKRLTGYGDMSFASVNEVKMFKTLTGGDTIYAERKGKDGFCFRYRGLFWFGANSFPHFGGDKGRWVYDRFIVYECRNYIPVRNRDKELVDKMYAESEAIVSVLINYLHRIIGNNYEFDIPASCRESLEKFMSENSSVVEFFKERCVIRNVQHTADEWTRQRIYDEFIHWYFSNGYSASFKPTKREFEKGIAGYLNMTTDNIIHNTSTRREYIFTIDTNH